MQDLMFAWQYEEMQVREIINDCDYKGAKKLLKKNKTTVNAILARLYPGYDDRAHLILEEGAKELLPVDDIENVWKLKVGWEKYLKEK